MQHEDDARRAGWQHHPGRKVAGPLDVVMQLPLAAGDWPLTLNLVYTDDGLYLPSVTRRPPGPGPFPTIVAIHGGSGGLGIPYLVDQVQNEGWAIEEMLARGYAVVLAEGRMELEDAYGSGYPGVLDHDDLITVLRWLARQPWVDPDRIGLFGASHGGEIQMKIACALGGSDPVRLAALAMCEPAIIEFLGLKYEGVRKEANLQFHAPIPDSRIDLAKSMERISRIPVDLPMLVVGRDEDHLQGPFIKLHELLTRAGRRAEWASFSHPDHAYQFGPRRGADGYRPGRCAARHARACARLPRQPRAEAAMSNPSDDAAAAPAVVRLRPAVETDWPRLKGWLGLPHVERWLGPKASSEAAIILAMGTEHAICRMIEADGVAVGYAHALDAAMWGDDLPPEVAPGTWDIDLVVGEPAARNRGIGSRALALVRDEVFATTLAPAVCVLVPIANERAIRAYEQAGFRWRRVWPDRDLGPTWLMIAERPSPKSVTGSLNGRPKCVAALITPDHKPRRSDHD